MDCSLQSYDEEEFPPLPVTPSKPPLPKKPNIIQLHKEYALTSDDAFRSLADLINSRSDTLEKMMESVRGEIKALDDKVVHVERRMERNESSALKTMNRVSELERYSRRWNLRLHGLTETREEDVRVRAISVCQAVLSEDKEKLADAIDVVHRVGKPRQDNTKPRGVIVRFISRRFRDAVWKAAKSNPYLQNKGLRFTEDLTQEDRENRQKLWPLIKKARDEGMKVQKFFLDLSKLRCQGLNKCRLLSS
ncbi:hypothetical protein D5F01_LYC19142 [Larimichthys crocea]|uniref:Uncharacterized protein n=1 Tax=Larimichthys crocea TaxID=215358 RepID=A0A6G0HRB2_LARCR|nr:hypothetical protein D5F01_LYC19142 [Larimichthys crocea]